MSAENYPGGEFVNLERLFDSCVDTSPDVEEQLSIQAESVRKNALELLKKHTGDLTGQNWAVFSEIPDITSHDLHALNRRRETLVYAYKVHSDEVPNLRIMIKEDFKYSYMDGDELKSGTNYLVEDIIIDNMNRARRFSGMVEANEDNKITTSQLQVPLFVTRNHELSIYGFSLSPNDDKIVDSESESFASLVQLEESSDLASSKGGL